MVPALLAAAVAVMGIPALAAGQEGAPPRTTITAGPQGQSDSPVARFAFSADRPASFQCQLDGGAFTACSSPYTTPSLALGPHSFSVRAVSPSGSVDLSPPTRQWTVVPTISTPAVKLIAPAGARVRASRLKRLAGTSAAPSGVVVVDVAIQQGGSKRNTFPPACRFIDPASGRIRTQDCVLPPYMAAHGTSAWSISLSRGARRRLKPGHYTVIVRALNALHNGTPQRFTITITR